MRQIRLAWALPIFLTISACDNSGMTVEEYERMMEKRRLEQEKAPKVEKENFSAEDENSEDQKIQDQNDENNSESTADTSNETGQQNNDQEKVSLGLVATDALQIFKNKLSSNGGTGFTLTSTETLTLLEVEALINKAEDAIRAGNLEQSADANEVINTILRATLTSLSEMTNGEIKKATIQQLISAGTEAAQQIAPSKELEEICKEIYETFAINVQLTGLQKEEVSALLISGSEELLQIISESIGDEVLSQIINQIYVTGTELLGRNQNITIEEAEAIVVDLGQKLNEIAEDSLDPTALARLKIQIKTKTDSLLTQLLSRFTPEQIAAIQGKLSQN